MTHSHMHHSQKLRNAARAVLNRARELSMYAHAGGVRSRDDQLRFLILAGAHRGSHLLIDLLNRHPNLHCDGEILGRRSACRLVNPDLFIRGHAAQRREDCYGCKISVGHLSQFQKLDPQMFLQEMHRRGWRLIHLIRTNVLRVCISSMLAHQRRQWHATNDTPVTPAKVRVDCDELHRQLVLRSETLRTESECLSGLPSHQIVYEQDPMDTSRHQITLDRVFQFLDLPEAEVSASLVRTSPESIREMVDNYDQVVQSLNGTPYAEFFERSLNQD